MRGTYHYPYANKDVILEKKTKKPATVTKHTSLSVITRGIKRSKRQRLINDFNLWTLLHTRRFLLHLDCIWGLESFMWDPVQGKIAMTSLLPKEDGLGTKTHQGVRACAPLRPPSWKGVLERKKCRICSLIHFFGGLEKLIIILENNISYKKINLDRDVGAQCKDWNESGGCWKRPCGNCGLCWINYVCLWKVDRSYFRWSKG